MSNIWGVALEGHEFDLADWRELFAAPFAPWVELVPTMSSSMINVLRSREFDSANEAVEVYAMALPLMERLNGAALLARACDAVSFGGVAQIADGIASRHHFMTAVSILGRARVTAAGVVTGPDGELCPAPERTPSNAQNWVAKADQNELIAELLTHVFRATNWYDLYKAMELAEAIEGSKHKFWDRLGSRRGEWKAVRATANYFRHARSYRPPQLVDLATARALLIAITQDILQGSPH